MFPPMVMGTTAFPVLNSAYGDGSTGYLSRTPGGAGNTRQMTISAWFKLVKDASATTMRVFNATDSGSGAYEGAQLSDKAAFRWHDGSFNTVSTDALLRDYTGVVHIVWEIDTDQATAADRVKIYINGVQQTVTGTQPTINYDLPLNDAEPHAIMSYPTGGDYLDGYISELVVVDGLALDPTYFGKLDLVTGNWIPKAPVVSAYGTNGFYLNFQNGAGLGDDSSGNGNDFTVNGTITQSTDTPTNNHATLNPLSVFNLSGTNTYSNGNKRIASAASNSDRVHSVGTLEVGSGKYKCDATVKAKGSAAAKSVYVGIFNGEGGIHVGWTHDGDIFYNTAWAGSATIATWATNDVLSFELDADARTVELFKNDVSQGTFAVSGTEDMTFGCRTQYNSDFEFALAEDEWTYSAPTGFKALSTDNLPAVTGKNINDHVHTALVNHDGTSTNFEVPWDMDVYHTLFEIKNRDTAEKWFIVDTLRGITKYRSIDSATTETTDSNVISVSGTTATLGSTLLNDNYVITCKKAGLIGSETSGTTAGGKAYEYSVNTVLGFCVTLYTGDGAAAHDIPHGLGIAPAFHFCFNRGAVSNFSTYHSALGATKYVLLNTTAAVGTASTIWNDTEPTASVITVSNSAGLTNQNILNNTYCSYSYAETDLTGIGYDTGNASTDGPFANEMLSPVYNLQKNSSSAAGQWAITDISRSPNNPIDLYLRSESSNAEVSTTLYDYVAVGKKDRFSSTSGHITIRLTHGQPTGGLNIAEATGH